MKDRNISTRLLARVGERIRSLRLERGLSLRKLAEMAKCSLSSLSMVESGGASIHVRTLQKIAQALQVEPFDVLNHTPENDDIGYIVEQMRQDPAARAMVKAQLEAWDATITPPAQASNVA